MRLTRRKSPSSAGKQLVAVPAPSLPVAFELELQQSFSDAYRRLHGPVFDHAERYLDRESAEDAVGQTMAELWSRWPQLTPEQRSDQYIFGAVHHTILDMLKARRTVVSLDDAEEELEILAARSVEAPSRVDTAADVVDALLASMPARRRDVFLLVREQLFTYMEAAEALGLSEGTINTHMRLATKDVQTALARAGFRIASAEFVRLPSHRGGAKE